MDPHDTSPRPSKAGLAAALGAAALAIPGGMLVSNAFAADESSSTTTAPARQTQDPYAPAQEERPDGRDCPEEQGGDGQSTAPSTGPGAQQTALQE